MGFARSLTWTGCLILIGGGAFAEGQEAEPVTVILVRHAEKAAGGGADPVLSDAGHVRAVALADLLAEAEVSHLFATEYQRTQLTLAPLAERLGLEVTTISGRHPERQIQALEGLPAGAVAVVAGHANTVPAMITALGGEVHGLESTAHGPMFSEDEYDRLFVVTLSNPVSTLELRYAP